MQEVIFEKVDLRLLTKTDRLFTGTMEVPIIKILNNARRAAKGSQNYEQGWICNLSG